MEEKQEKNYASEYEVIDLSQAEIGTNDSETEEYEYEDEARFEGRPKLYVFLIRHSGGLIENEKQAQMVAVLLILLMNLVTFFLLRGSDTVDTSAPVSTAEIENVLAD